MNKLNSLILLLTLSLVSCWDANKADERDRLAALNAQGDTLALPPSVMDEPNSVSLPSTAELAKSKVEEIKVEKPKVKPEEAVKPKPKPAPKPAATPSVKKALTTAPVKPKTPPTKKPSGATAATPPKKAETKVNESPTNARPRTGRDAVFTISEVAPAYPGGQNALVKYLQKSVKYPTIARENGMEGTVYVQFVIEKDGKVDDVTVAKGVSSSLDAEAKRVVSSMPKWSAGLQNGKPVAVQYTVPIKFELVK